MRWIRLWVSLVVVWAVGCGGEDASGVTFVREMGIAIVGPSGESGHATLAETIELSGVTFGEGTHIEWQVEGGASGRQALTEQWQISDVPLTLGMNRIEVRVIDEHSAEVVNNDASDHIEVFRNTATAFEAPPELDTTAIFSGETSELRVTIELDADTTSDPEALTLVLRDSEGVERSIATLADDGNLAQGDEIERDRIYSGIATLDEADEKILQVYVKTNSGEDRSAASELFVIDALSDDDLDDIQTAHDTAETAFDDALDSTGSYDRAADAAQAAFEAQPNVSHVERSASGFSVIAIFNHGVMSVVNHSPGQTRAGATPVLEAPSETQLSELASPAADATGGVRVGKSNALLMSSYFGEVENGKIRDFMKASSCPKYTYSGVHLNEKVTFDMLRTWSRYGVISWATHGDTFDSIKIEKDSTKNRMLGLKSNKKNAKTVLLLRGNTDSATLKRADVQKALRTGAAVLFDKNDLAITARFFEKWIHRLPGSLVHLGACRSMRTGDMPRVLLKKGAKAVVGYTNYVDSGWAEARATELFKCLLERKSDGSVRSTKECYKYKKETTGHRSEWVMLPKNHDLNLLGSELSGGGFENKQHSWRGDGDARVLSQLGSYTPTEGNKMGLISTGLGYSSKLGSFKQALCLPEGSKTLDFDWNFISAEFKAYCGDDRYQDRFVVRATDAKGSTATLMSKVIDDLCASVVTSGIELPSHSTTGDEDGTYATDWQKATLDVSALSGDISLEFGVNDAGDELYDTAVLIDDVRFSK